MHDFLYGFLTWFKAFFDNMLGGVLMVVKGDRPGHHQDF